MISKLFMIGAWRQNDQFACPHPIHVRCCSGIPGMTKTAGGCLPTVDHWAWAGCVVVWWARSSNWGAGKLCKLCPLRREASSVTMAQSIWLAIELYSQTQFFLFDSSVFQRQENRMNFVSCLKTVSMRIDVETLPFLMTDSDIPILRVAMAYTAHEEALLRTQARNAMLALFSKMKMGEEQLLRIALEMAKSRKLGWVIGKSWHLTWHVMPLYWIRKGVMLEDLCVVTLEFLVHLFLVRRLAHCSLRRFILHLLKHSWSQMSLSTFDCIPDFQGCRPLCALCCGRIGQTWHKQPKTGVLRLCKNGHSVKRTVFPVPHKGVRVGGQYGTRPSEKRRTRLLQNLNSQILFKQKQRRPRAGCTVLYPQIYVYQRDVIGLGFCEADRQCDQSNSGLFPGKGVGCPWSG